MYIAGRYIVNPRHSAPQDVVPSATQYMETQMPLKRPALPVARHVFEPFISSMRLGTRGRVAAAPTDGGSSVMSSNEGSPVRKAWRRRTRIDDGAGLGDTSALPDPRVLDALISGRRALGEPALLNSARGTP